MGHHGKQYRDASQKNNLLTKYPPSEAFKILSTFPRKKFDETVDIACRLGIDPSKSDQMVRGTVVLPNGTGKSVRVAVFAKGEKQAEATEAGADAVGGDDLIQKVSGGWLEFDRAIATPDMMGSVSKIGKVLGPKGLMPNPKLGTVTFDIGKAVKEQKAGKIEFRSDKEGNLHAILGKASFGPEKLVGNFNAFVEAVLRAKPASSKGVFLQGVTVSTTMSPGIKIDIGSPV
ncbi:MAG TPA: 50S ribosomal protein L1 [Bdellovibrionota bacterium]|nr:50S ribosomal protein L1 [Bdellovibrionota bacterium]